MLFIFLHNKILYTDCTICYGYVELWFFRVNKWIIDSET